MRQEVESRKLISTSRVEEPLFNGPMVRAILAGRKTQTRRVVKPQPDEDGLSLWFPPSVGVPASYDHDAWVDTSDRIYKCPYGQPGDRLWVRETWAHYQTINHARRSHGGSFAEVSDGLAAYRADGFDTIEDLRKHIRLTSGHDLEAVEIREDRWRPSIHMPSWACRLVLEITGVRVERLQEISYDDAEAEGIEQRWTCLNPGTGSYAYANDVHDDFRSLWDSLAASGVTWADNPWVWVVEFKRMEAACPA